MLSEAEARQILQGPRADAIARIVESAWDAHVAENRPRSRRTRANIVWEYMAEFAERDLPAMPGVVRRERHGIPMYAFDDRLVLRFKKHDPGVLLTHNIATEHQLQISEQGHFVGMPTLVHLSCGYVLDAAEASVAKIVVVRRVKRAREWWIDMRELAAGVLAPATPMLPTAPVTSVALPGIKPAAREEGGDGSK